MVRWTKLPMAQLLLLTIPDVAIQLGVCRATVYNLIYYKGLPSVLLGSVWRVHPDSLREWLKQCEQQPAPGAIFADDLPLMPMIGVDFPSVSVFCRIRWPFGSLYASQADRQCILHE